jgi:AraC-like DNA-binding protein
MSNPQRAKLLSNTDSRIQALMRLVEDRHGTLNLSLDEIGSQLGISGAHLYRLFKQMTGITFRHYLREVRITKAAEELRDLAKSIKQVADESGYSDVSNFYHDFKKIRGLTPRQYRLTSLSNHILEAVKE